MKQEEGKHLTLKILIFLFPLIDAKKQNKKQNKNRQLTRKNEQKK